MRLFVAVRPPTSVMDTVARLPRAPVPGVRWTTPAQWHVTLCFLGEVADPAPVTAAVWEAVSPTVSPTARLGPCIGRFGRTILQVPVHGLEPLARLVSNATAAIGAAPDDRPFRGHLTLARCRRRLPPGVVGTPLAAEWDVPVVEVVRSTLADAGARHDTVATVSLGD